MTSSGTYTFEPTVGSLVINAYGRIGIRRTEIEVEHLSDAALEANLLLQEWSNRGVNLWEVDLQSVALSAGVATLTLAESTVTVLDAYIETSSGSATTGRILFSISRSEYASYPNKLIEGFPTSFWLNRVKPPTLTLWPVPDVSGAYTLKYYRMRAAQDANLANGETIDLPDRFVEAFVAGLAHRLARHYAPNLEAARKTDAQEAWNLAGGADVESVPIYISPQLSSYYRP